MFSYDFWEHLRFTFYINGGHKLIGPFQEAFTSSSRFQFEFVLLSSRCELFFVETSNDGGC